MNIFLSSSSALYFISLFFFLLLTHISTRLSLFTDLIYFVYVSFHFRSDLNSLLYNTYHIGCSLRVSLLFVGAEATYVNQ